MAELRERGIVLEICPTSNLLTKALPDEAAVRLTFRAFVDARRPLHDRHRRPGDDAHAPARRAGPAPAGSAPWTRTSSARPTRAGTRPASCAAPPSRAGVIDRNTPFGLWSGRRAASSVPRMSRTLIGRAARDHRTAARGRRPHRGRLLERGGRSAPRDLRRARPRRTPTLFGRSSECHGAADPRCVPQVDGRRPAPEIPLDSSTGIVDRAPRVCGLGCRHGGFDFSPQRSTVRRRGRVPWVGYGRYRDSGRGCSPLHHQAASPDAAARQRQRTRADADRPCRLREDNARPRVGRRTDARLVPGHNGDG